MVGLADPLSNPHNVCLSNGDTATLAYPPEDPRQSDGTNSTCPPVKAGKGKGVDIGPHQGKALVGMASKCVDVAKGIDSDPESFEVEPLSKVYCEDVDLEYDSDIIPYLCSP